MGKIGWLIITRFEDRQAATSSIPLPIPDNPVLGKQNVGQKPEIALSQRNQKAATALASLTLDIHRNLTANLDAPKILGDG